MGKIVWQELKNALKETGERLHKLSISEVFIVAPFLVGGFILLLFVSVSVFLSSAQKR